MKQRRPTAVTPPIGKQQAQPETKKVQSGPIPLREGALTQVSGGVRTVSTATPQHNW
jgi:hypothetical protein